MDSKIFLNKLTLNSYKYDNYAIHKKLETATVCQYRSSSGSVTVSSYKMIGAPSHSYFSRNLLMHEEISPRTVTTSFFKQAFTVW